MIKHKKASILIALIIPFLLNSCGIFLQQKGMRLKQIKKWLLRIAFILVITSTIVVVFANHELKHMYGGYTEVVDATQFDVIAKPTTITNVNILSPDGSHFIKNQTVRLDKGKISSIDTINQFPKDDIIINGQGKYLIPGLIEGTLLTSRGLGWLPNVNLYRLPKNLSSEKKLSRKYFWKTYT